MPLTHESEVDYHRFGTIWNELNSGVETFRMRQHGVSIVPWGINFDIDGFSFFKTQGCDVERGEVGGEVSLHGKFVKLSNELIFFFLTVVIMPAILLDQLLDEFVTNSKTRIFPSSFVMFVHHDFEDILATIQQVKLAVTHLLVAFEL